MWFGWEIEFLQMLICKMRYQNNFTTLCNSIHVSGRAWQHSSVRIVDRIVGRRLGIEGRPALEAAWGMLVIEYAARRQALEAPPRRQAIEAAQELLAIEDTPPPIRSFNIIVLL